jgi:hypothetical protein
VFKRLRTLGFVCFSLLLGSPAAVASISVVGIGNYAMPKQTLLGASVPGLSGTLGLGGGALVDFRLSQGGAIGVELGVLFSQLKYRSGAIDFSFNQLELPLTLKMRFGRLVFLSAGGYFADGIGTVSMEGASVGFVDAGLRPISYGLLAGVGFRIPLSVSVSVRIEGRYRYQLSNSSSSDLVALDPTARVELGGAQFFAGVILNLGR